MLPNGLKFLSVLMLGGLTICACVRQGRSYIVISEPFTLKEGNTVLRTFDLPEAQNTPSVDLGLVHDNLNNNTGRFRINDKPFVDFQISKDYSLPAGLHQVHRFTLPRSWFKTTDNTIELEHISGEGMEVMFIRLEYNDLDKSPYED
jgi:hypothetical protein